MNALPALPLDRPRRTGARTWVRPGRWAMACAALGLCLAAQALPFTPATDAEIVERLPLSATDPAVRRVDSLRKQIAAQPANATLRIDLARRYFDLSMAQGDPRYVGYAQAALQPLQQQPGAPASYWLVRGMLQQYSHDFAGALGSLQRALELDARLAEAMAWRAAIFMVQARYPEAAAECARMSALVQPLFASGCSAYVMAQSGRLQAGYEQLLAAVQAAPGAAPELLTWEYTRLGEMAQRLRRPQEAEGHFRRALAQGVTDQFLLGAWADFLLGQGRPREVIELLASWERSDVLLLRLALAGKASGDARTEGWVAQLRERFAAAAQRGDRLHEQEAARFELDLEGHAAKALDLASSNYASQKEPRDAQILMRSALAARQGRAAIPALNWLRESGHEDPELQDLAARLTVPGAAGAAGAAGPTAATGASR